MCVTATVGMAIASFAIGAAQSVMQYQAASNQAEAQTAMYERNVEASNQATVNKYAHQQNRMIQEAAATSQEKQNIALEAEAARSTARVAAGEGGVTGLSVDSLIGDYHAKQGRYERTLDRNHQMNADYLRAEMDSTQAQGQSRINSMQPGQKPSFAGAALRIAGSGLGAYSTYRRQENRIAAAGRA